MAQILITGCAGLIGSHFSTYLLDKGHAVFGIDDLSGGYADFVDERMRAAGTFYDGSLLDTAKLEEVFAAAKPEYVYHFAAYAAEGLSPFIRNFNYQSNLIASVNVVNACVRHGAKKIIFTSSMAVYGHGTPPFRESQVPDPADPYGIAKYAVEMDLKIAKEQFGLDYSIARPHNVIGIRQNIWDRYRNVIGIWIRRAMQGQSICIFGDGTQKRAFSDIRFYMEPFEKLMTGFGGEAFNLGADKEYELREVAELVREIAAENGYNAPIEYLERRNEVDNAYCDHTKAKEMLGFHDETDLAATIREMFAWAKEQPEREVKTMPYEIEKGMYGFWK